MKEPTFLNKEGIISVSPLLTSPIILPPQIFDRKVVEVLKLGKKVSLLLAISIALITFGVNISYSFTSPCSESLDLPETVDISVFLHSTSYLRTIIHENPPGNDLEEGSRCYETWSINISKPLTCGQAYNNSIISSDFYLSSGWPDSTPVPEEPEIGTWELITWLINHKGTASREDIQNAIWYFTNNDTSAVRSYIYGDSEAFGLVQGAYEEVYGTLISAENISDDVLSGDYVGYDLCNDTGLASGPIFPLMLCPGGLSSDECSNQMLLLEYSDTPSPELSLAKFYDSNFNAWHDLPPEPWLSGMTWKFLLKCPDDCIHFDFDNLNDRGASQMLMIDEYYSICPGRYSLEEPLYPPYIEPEMMNKWAATTPNPSEVEVSSSTGTRWICFGNICVDDPGHTPGFWSNYPKNWDKADFGSLTYLQILDELDKLNLKYFDGETLMDFHPNAFGGKNGSEPVEGSTHNLIPWIRESNAKAMEYKLSCHLVAMKLNMLAQDSNKENFVETGSLIHVPDLADYKDCILTYFGSLGYSLIDGNLFMEPGSKFSLIMKIEDLVTLSAEALNGEPPGWDDGSCGKYSDFLNALHLALMHGNENLSENGETIYYWPLEECGAESPFDSSETTSGSTPLATSGSGGGGGGCNTGPSSVESLLLLIPMLMFFKFRF